MPRLGRWPVCSWRAVQERKWQGKRIEFRQTPEETVLSAARVNPDQNAVGPVLVRRIVGGQPVHEA